MAKLYATSPNGTAKSMDIFFDEYFDSGSSENGYAKYTLFSNGMFIYGADAQVNQTIVLPVASYCSIQLTPLSRYNNTVMDTVSYTVCYPYVYFVDDVYYNPVTRFTIKCRASDTSKMLIFFIVIGNLKYT